MKNNYILVYKHGGDVFVEEEENIKELVFRMLENEESSEEYLLEDPLENMEEIVKRVNNCFDIEYDKYDLQYIIFYSGEENGVDVFNHEDCIPDNIKLKLYLQYYEDWDSESNILD